MTKVTKPIAGVKHIKFINKTYKQNLKELMDYFVKNDKTPFEHKAYSVINELTYYIKDK